MSKRANGEGSIYKTKDGRWKVSLSLGSAGGKRKRILRNAATRADAVAILAKLRGDGPATVTKATDRISVAGFMDVWLTHVATHKSPATTNLYKSMSSRIVVPRIGTIRLASLATEHVQAFADALSRDDVPPRTRQVAFSVLRAALRFAIKTRRIAVDPTIGIDKPQHQRKDIFPFTREESLKIIDAKRETRWHALLVLAFSTGMRQGELFGLPWSAVDLKAKKLRIVQAAAEVAGKVTIQKPKTANSIRTIELPQVAIAALMDHRAILLKEGNGGNKLVFPAPEGGLIPRSTFRHRYWLPILKSLGLASRGFHHTRHTYATLSLGAGVPVHVVSSVLGHSKTSTTHDVYAAVLPTHQAAAAEAAQRLFG